MAAAPDPPAPAPPGGPAEAHPPPRRRAGLPARLLGALLGTAALAVLVEGAASWLLAWRDAGAGGIREELHCRYDPDLGWSHRPSVHVADLYGPGKGLTTNARGFRGTGELGAAVPPGRYRIVCLGDSFTLGYGVDDAETYEAWLERLEPRVQAVNMGQGGYGADQAYLWYLRDGLELEADLVLLAAIAPDFERMLSGRFQGGYPKPYLRLEDGELVVDGVPVPETFGRGGLRRRVAAWWEQTATADLLERLARRTGRSGARREAVGGPLPYRAVAEAMLADLQARVAERGARFAVALLPLRDPAVGRAPEVAAWLHGLAAERGFAFVDVRRAFEAVPATRRELYYQPDGHLNALGNRLVAETLLAALDGAIDGFPE